MHLQEALRESAERMDPDQLVLGHVARRAAREKRAQRYLLPPATGKRNVRRVPAGGPAKECAVHLQEALRESAERMDLDQLVLGHAARRAARQKRAPAGGAAGPRGQARGATNKRTAAPAAAGDREEKHATSTCRRSCKGARSYWTSTK